MKLSEIKNILATAETVNFKLENGTSVPGHFHVTEVGRIDKNFIDCGGTRRQSASCLLQTWTANDVDHRLVAGKLAEILKLAFPILGSAELPVELEYGAAVAAQYTISNVEVSPRSVTFGLTGKQTACLAPDKCGVGGCDPKSGCC